MNQTQNDQLSDWLPHRETYLSTLLEMEAPRQQNCQQCKSADVVFRCMDCLGQPILCQICTLEFHQKQPFHRLQRWNGRYLSPCRLMDLGFVIHLGHGGEPCPGLPESSSGQQSRDSVLCMIDQSGVYHHKIRACACPGSPNLAIQLLRMQFYPSTMTKPETVFTFSVLDDFYIDAMECKTSANNYFNKLRRLTDNAFPHMVPVCLTITGCAVAHHRNRIVTKIS